MEFSGVETINVRVHDEPTDFIEIHAMAMEITFLKVFNNETSVEVPVNSMEYFLATEKLLIKFSQSLLKDQNYRVHVEFKGELKNDMRGLYISSYYDFNYFLR